MKNLIVQTVILVILLSSCNDYSDHKIIVDKSNLHGVLDTVEIEVGVQGSQKLNYDIEIRYNGEFLAKDSVTSNSKPIFKKVKIDFGKLKEKTIDFSADLVKQGNIKLDFVLSNERKKIVIDSSIPMAFRLPPISQPLSISFGEGTADLISPLQKQIIEVRKKFPKYEDRTIHRIAFLSEVLRLNQKGLHLLNRVKSLKPVRKQFEINLNLTTDTIFKHTIIGRYPAINNSHYIGVDIEKIISDYVETRLDSIKSDWAGNKDGGGYFINYNSSSDYVGLIGIYLININQFGEYTFQQIASFISDTAPPRFSNSKYCSEPNNPDYEGIVCLYTEKFFGWSPFKVPFVGRAYGDIKSIYIDNKKVDFKIGEEIYFKKSVYLDGGYNRVPIKLIDGSGNVTESFIPITMEDMGDNNINNNISIDNN
ncbi:hypothetical protein [Flagellimonas halotolerans]|uniref:Uncharacterized protein n=1 Tax=Flagellimonas halotolerans TaxID=3112164 RepID=A0ABU6IUD4_9FLAO|nr:MULTISPECIES: hypothetical protein [unclassified Allomuricauda]MEC3966793.1 hypothetical protein [Muricauda sp. SYSU M86414]MEC4266691.1 hypothetical protein [Muricauda sp. SYSU M84420]